MGRRALLVVVSRLDIHAFIENEVTWVPIHIQDLLLALDCARLILKRDQNEAETSPTTRNLIPHHNRVLDFAVLFKVGEQFILGC